MNSIKLLRASEGNKFIKPLTTHKLEIKLPYATGGSKKKIAKPKLLEVGKLEHPKKRADYTSGQLFLNKTFGYRGIVLFSWKPVVINRDLPAGHSNSLLINKMVQEPETDIDLYSKNKCYYYQVLIDSRDIDHTRATSEPATFIINQNRNKTLYAIPALDYVTHDDILPYRSSEKTPFQHDLLRRFFVFVPSNEPQYVAHAALKTWKQWNEAWLEPTRVITETSHDVKVTVLPFYLGERTSQTYWWRYCVRIENLGSIPLQLKGRLMRLYNDGTSYLQTLRGKLENEVQPIILDKQNPAYQYTSHVTLDVPISYAWGSVILQREDGRRLESKIPLFTLDCAGDCEMI